MSDRIPPIIRKIMGRLKKMVADIFIQYGAMGIPVGFAIMFGSYELFDGWLVQLGIWTGVIIVLASCYAFAYAYRRRKREYDDAQSQMKKQFEALIKEIRKVGENIADSNRGR